MLHNKNTNSVLTCNINEKVLGMMEGYVALGSECHNPAIKSVFILIRAEKDFFTDDVIHYGQKVKIIVNPRLTNKPLYLHSAHIAP